MSDESAKTQSVPSFDEIPYTEDGESPFHPRNLSNLFIRPRKFFTSRLALNKTGFIIIATWVYGIVRVIGEIEEEVLRADISGQAARLELIAPVVESWGTFWTWSIVFGAGSGLLYWLIGGWWFRLRLIWSGATDPDKRTARLAYIYPTLVLSLPTILYYLGQTVFFLIILKPIFLLE